MNTNMNRAILIDITKLVFRYIVGCHKRAKVESSGE